MSHRAFTATMPRTSVRPARYRKESPVARRRSRTYAHAAVLVAALVGVASYMPVSAIAQSAAAPAAARLDGLWDATIVTGGATIPFRFEIETKGTAAKGSFFEGDRKIESSEGTYSGGVLKLVWDHLNTSLELTNSGGTVTGDYVNRRPNSRSQEAEMARFTAVTTDA